MNEDVFGCVEWCWGEVEQSAFDAIKAAMLTAPMLYHLDYDLPIRIRTDASTIGIGAVLFQVIDGVEKPVAYLSKAFNETERKWSTIEQETFAVVYAAIQWEHMLLGHPWVLETDHKNILWLEKATAPKLVRLRLRLQAGSGRRCGATNRPLNSDRPFSSLW